MILLMAILYTRRELFELFAVAFVKLVVLADFTPEGIGMVHVVNMRQLMNNNVVAERLWDFHKADIE